MSVAAAVGALGAGVLLGSVFNIWVAVGLGAAFGAAVTGTAHGRQPARSKPGLHGRAVDVIKLLAGGMPGGILGTVIGAFFGGRKGLAAGALARATSSTHFNPAAGLAIGVAAGLGFAIAGRFTPAGGATSASPTDPRAMFGLKAVLQGCVLGLVAGLLGSVALGYVGGAIVALACLLSVAIVIELETAVDVKTIATSTEVLRTDRHNALYMLILFGLTVWLAVTSASWQIMSHPRSIVFGFGAGVMDGLGFCLGFTAWGNWLIFTRGWMTVTRQVPRRFIPFLEDAHRRGVLRQAGAVYQFRHARLQDRLIANRQMVPAHREDGMPAADEAPADVQSVQELGQA
jgi:hypothetical protein